MELQDRVALVTGASRGIGRAIALRLAALGAAVALNYKSGEEKAREVEAEILSLGGRAMLAPADVTDASQVKNMTKAVTNRMGRLDILVNNAGLVRNELLLRMTEQSWDEVVDTNLKGAYLCTKYCLLPMMENGWGRIINISSIAGIRGNYGQSNYSAAKGGLISFTRSVAREVGVRNITVNALAPGLIRTDMLTTVPGNHVQAVLGRLAIRRIGTPEDIASLVGFLASEKAGYITGQVIGVDGGFV